MKKIAFVVNGEIRDYPHLKNRLKQFDLVIAVDGGMHHLLQIDHMPDLLIGDLDSLELNEAKKNELESKLKKVEKHPKDKDETDLELALCHLRSEDVGVIFGGFGFFPDHTFMHYVLLTRYQGHLFLEGDVLSNNTFFCVLCMENLLELEGEIGDRISLLPINGKVSGVFSSGLKWDLDDATLSKGFTGISNEMSKNKVKITVESGDLLVFFQKKVEGNIERL